jgi:hypothetical protein
MVNFLKIYPRGSVIGYLAALKCRQSPDIQAQLQLALLRFFPIDLVEPGKALPPQK